MEYRKYAEQIGNSGVDNHDRKKSEKTATLIAVILIMSAIVGCAFTGARKTDERTIVFTKGDITITVTSEYADQIYLDSLYSDNIFTVIANIYYKPDYKESNSYTAQTCDGWMISVTSFSKVLAGTDSRMETGLATEFIPRATDKTNVYVEEYPFDCFYHYKDHPENTEVYDAILKSIQIDYGNLEPYQAGEFSPQPKIDDQDVSGGSAETTAAENSAAVSNHEPTMTDYLTYNLPKGLSNGGFSEIIGNGLDNIFIYDKAKIEDNPNASQEWLASGGVMFYDRSLIDLENSEISSVQPMWNHSVFLTAPERIPNCEAYAVIVEAEHDLYTAKEVESAKAAGNPIPEEKQIAKMWYVFFAQEDGNKAYAVYLNENYFSKDDMIKFAQSVHFMYGAFYLNDPNLQYSQEYIAGTGNIKGNVNTKYFADITPDFEIGANSYGVAVFKNPDAALARLIKDYKAGIDLIQREVTLPPLSQHNFEAYGIWGWQVTTGTKEEKEQAVFVSGFMDIYENSYQN